MTVTALLALARLAARKSLSALCAYPWQAALALLALYTWHEHTRAAKWRENAATEAASHARTRAAYTAAQEQAAAAARAARLEWENRSQELAQEIDDAKDQTADWRARAARFADGGGLYPSARPSAQGATGDPTTPAPADPATGGERSGPAPVVLSRSDFDTLSENTARLLKVHAWGEKLVAAGMAQVLEEKDAAQGVTPP
ncbi:hypothetical protein MTR62_07195 [Novosphingobium sp. 1949]|uniref:Uncharacterized protein n=1 Tax=Novosphingobium organovorum TaxID=2930092 RepID=A0ABT0BC79_9SPHN|nr:hypothetical protein [Novosphingobium organovorum]MCJ2182478.1 hypothetical protein [Novosphingobium organovorum]